MLKGLIDPNVAPARALAREEGDLVIAANNSHVLAFDNLSGLSHAAGAARSSRRWRADKNASESVARRGRAQAAQLAEHPGTRGPAPSRPDLPSNLGIEMTFSRHGRAGTRTIRISSAFKDEPRLSAAWVPLPPSMPSVPSALSASSATKKLGQASLRRDEIGN
jgi:hypothetical protein